MLCSCWVLNFNSVEEEKGLNEVQRIVQDLALDDGAERSKISSFNFMSFGFMSKAGGEC